MYGYQRVMSNAVRGGIFEFSGADFESFELHPATIMITAATNSAQCFMARDFVGELVIMLTTLSRLAGQPITALYAPVPWCQLSDGVGVTMLRARRASRDGLSRWFCS